MTKMHGYFGLVVVSSCLLASPLPSFSQASRAMEQSPTKLFAEQKPAKSSDLRRAQKYVPNELLVRFRKGVSAKSATAQHSAVGATMRKEFRAVENLQLVRLPTGMSVKEAVRYYRARPDVLYAEPNYFRHAGQSPTVPNDPRFPEMWSLHNFGQNGGTAGADIHAPEAWSITTGSSSVVVGIIDTGIDYNHPDLSQSIFRNSADCNANGIDDDNDGYKDDCHGIDTYHNDSDPMDDAGHGTHVAGTIGAVGSNGVGVVGVNWQVQIIACKFLGPDGWGNDADAIECLQYFATLKDHGVNIVATNNSWGGGDYSSALKDAIDSNRKRGILFVAAAGNSWANMDLVGKYPAGYDLPNILSVAATDNTDARANFSNFGRHSVHVAAPGVSILSTVPAALYGDAYRVASGTSMAAPHVTGVTALLKAQNPALDWKQIKNLIMAGGDVVSGAAETISQRRLNAFGALTCSEAVIQEQLQPLTDNAYVFPGDSLTIKFLNIRCAQPNGNLEAIIDGGPEKIAFRDDGVAPDFEAGDGVYVATRQWTTGELGYHTLGFPNGKTLQVHVINTPAPYNFSTEIPLSYRDIEGTDLQLGDDDSTMIQPPFPVQFGGINFQTLHVNSNGNVTFLEPFIQWENSPLPTADASILITPFWDDIYSYLHWSVLGSAPNRELVIDWSDVSSMGCVWAELPTGYAKFQLVFFESSSDILFNYADVTMSRAHDPNDDWWGCIWDADAGASATVGVQSSPTLANQFSFDTPSLSENFSILWQVGNPRPSIIRISPFAVTTHDSAFTLHVYGQSFLPGAEARWNGVPRPTTFVTGGEIAAAIASSDIATAADIEITVRNSTSNGGAESAPASLTIYDNYPVPTLDGSVPSEIPFGRVATLNLTGTGFTPGSAARWNGSALETFPINSTQLQVKVPSSTPLGSAQISVFNPTPGGGTSNPLQVTVVNPVPSIAWVNRFLGANGKPLSLDLLGVDVMRNSVVQWNNQDRTTSVTENRHGLTAQLLATDLASPGTAELTIYTPPPGGGTSTPVTISLMQPPPNDEVANAIPVTPIPFSFTQSPLGATRDSSDPPVCDNARYETLWFSFTMPPSGGFVKADALGSNYDNWISAWTGSPGNWVSLGCAATWVGQGVGFTAPPNTPVYLVVSTQNPGYISEYSNVVVHVSMGTGFKLDLSPSTNVVPRGTPATYTATISPDGGSFDEPVELSCWVVGYDNPPWPPCTLSQSRITPGANTVSVTLTINTTSVSAMTQQSDATAPSFGWLTLLPAMGIVLIPFCSARRRWMSLLVIAALIGMQSGCGGTGSSHHTNPVNTAPSITSLVPSSASAGGAGFVLAVNGTNFVSNSVVRWNGMDCATSFVSSSQLTATITAADIASPGTFSVTVYNPSGGTSLARTFPVTATVGHEFVLGIVAKSGTLSREARATLTVN